MVLCINAGRADGEQESPSSRPSAGVQRTPRLTPYHLPPNHSPLPSPRITHTWSACWATTLQWTPRLTPHHLPPNTPPHLLRPLSPPAPRTQVELMASKHHPHLVRLLGYCVTTDAKTHSSPPAPKHSSLSPPAPPSQVELMASKHHPHLVRLLGYCVSTDAKTHEQEQIIIYEFMENGDLERVLKNLASRPVSLQQRLEMMIGAARGLEYLHSFSMVHRDVKPANILLDGNWQVCLEYLHGFSMVHRDVKPANILLDGNWQYLHGFSMVHRDVKPANILLDGNWQVRVCESIGICCFITLSTEGPGVLARLLNGASGCEASKHSPGRQLAGACV
ncbi:unnamed protein product [Closterium sp. Naga37s-1]|nr:unnamed protein product [Closterium sp. Naga37s-1]